MKEKIKKFISDYRNSDLKGEKMSVKELFSTGYTDFGINSLNMIVDTYHFLFLTWVLRIPLGHVATLIAAVRFIDIARDLIVAGIVDRTRTKWGRFKPYVVILPPIAALLSVLFFFNSGSTMSSRLAYAYVTFIAFGLVRSFVRVGWDGFVNTLSNDAEDKRRYFTFGNFGRILAGAIPGVIPLIISFAPEFGVNIRVVFIISAILFAAIGTVGMSFSRNLRERVIVPQRENPLKSILVILKNKWMLVRWADKIGRTVMTLSWAIGGFIFIFNFGDFFYQTLVWSIPSIPTFFMAAFAPFVLKRIRPAKFMIFNHLVNALCIFAIFLFGYQSFGGGLAAIIPLLIFKLIAAIPSRINEVAGSIMNNDCFDYIEVKTGQRYEATTNTIGGILDRLGEILSVFVLAYLLGTVIGFDPAASTQTPEALQGLWYLYCWSLIIGFLLQAVPYFFYKLDGDLQKRISAELSRRKELLDKGEPLNLDLQEIRRNVLQEK
jgi:Na+/melibiose symporter-like transporter